MFKVGDFVVCVDNNYDDEEPYEITGLGNNDYYGCPELTMKNNIGQPRFALDFVVWYESGRHVLTEVIRCNLKKEIGKSPLETQEVAEFNLKHKYRKTCRQLQTV